MKVRIFFLLCFIGGAFPLGCPSAHAQLQRAGSDPESSGTDKTPAAVSVFRDVDRLIEQAAGQIPSVTRCFDMKAQLSPPALLVNPELKWAEECRLVFPQEQLNALKNRLEALMRSGGTFSKESAQVMMQLEDYDSGVRKCIDAKRKKSSAMPALSPYYGMYADCQKNTSLESLVRQKKIAEKKIMSYYACAAVAAGSDAPCQKIGATGDRKGQEYQRRCRHWYDEAALFKAIATGSPEAGKMCDAVCAQAPTWAVHPTAKRPPFSIPEFCTKACELMRTNPHDAKICARTARFFPSPAEAAKSCEEDSFLPDFYTMDLALGGDCAKAHFLWQKDGCREYSSFKKASGARNPGLCGDNPLCRSMMGEGASACEAYIDMEKAPVCGGGVGQKIQAMNERAEHDFQLKTKQINEACEKIVLEVRVHLDKSFEAINRVLPGTPGREARSKKLERLYAVYRDLVKKNTRRAPKTIPKPRQNSR